MDDRNNKLILERLKEWWTSMADRLDDFIYTDETKEMMDIVNLLLLGWILLGLIVYIVGNLVASHIRRKKDETEIKSKGIAGRGLTNGETLTADIETSHVQSIKDAGSEEVVCSKTVVSDSESIKKSNEATSLPITTGDDPDVVQWVNSLLTWLFVKKETEPILEAWLSALNKKTSSAETEHGILINFKEVLTVGHLPVLNNVYATTTDGSTDNITVACHLQVEKISCLITITQFKEKEKISVPYKLLIEKLDGKINIHCIPDSLSFTVTFLENPFIKFLLKPDSEVILPSSDQQALEDVLMDIITEALAAANVHFSLSHLKQCPQLQKRVTGYEKFSAEPPFSDEEKLLVKVIKATDLTKDDGKHKPYCIVEMDEPAQKFQTMTSEGANPLWDEAFIFSVKNLKAELLFEIYDKEEEDKEEFLGLGIVSIEELLESPSQKHIINLQSRPLEKDVVTGSLFVEFFFLDKELPLTDLNLVDSLTSQDMALRAGKIVETNSRVTPGGTIITTTTIKRAPQEDAAANLTDTALQELETREKITIPSKSTLIIHSVQRLKLDKAGKWQEVSQERTSTPEGEPPSPQSKAEQMSNIDSASSSPSDKGEYQRSRSKERKSFMGTLRKKLSFRKTRSKSMEHRSHVETEPVFTHGSIRSVSTDRTRSVGGSREPSSVRSSGNAFLKIPGGASRADSSTRSSISEASGISGSSSRTYINENSTLVIETNENGIIKRYLIPTSLATRSRWRKRGTKLHIYNDHTFVAKHFSGSTPCDVCNKHLSRRPGKQGYICRDCNLPCHKQCHVKVPEYCPNSSVSGMEVEYIQDPYTKSKRS